MALSKHARCWHFLLVAALAPGCGGASGMGATDLPTDDFGDRRPKMSTPGGTMPSGGACGTDALDAPDAKALGVILVETDLATLQGYTQAVGHAPAVVMRYQDWVHQPTFDAAWAEDIVAHCAVPMVTWEPWNRDGGPFQPAFALRNITNGQYDALITKFAQQAATWGQPFFLRFAHEMNLQYFHNPLKDVPPPYSWNPEVNGNTWQDYRNAWQHVWKLMRSQGASNVRFVWSPSVITKDHTAPFSSLYPGDAFVDWVGLDGYNWGTSQDGRTAEHVLTGDPNWQSMLSVFSLSYFWLDDLTKKPMMITETASTEQGGDKAQWIRQGFLDDLVPNLPRVRAVLWFQDNKETDWRVNSTREALEGYQEVLDSPMYQGHLSL